MLSPWIFTQLILIGHLQAGDAIYHSLLVSTAVRGDFPYMVKIVERAHGKQFSCNGAIIDASHILTAAHCVFHSIREKITVFAGLVDEESIYSKRSGVARIHVPKEFRDHGHRCRTWHYVGGWVRTTWENIKNERDYCLVKNDIAVLKLTNALPFGDYIKAVKLPDSDWLPYCELCIFSGWGQTEKDKPPSQQLHWTYLMIVEAPNKKMISSSEFWARDPILETCPLKGDSGAPLVFNNTVYGVESSGRGNPCIPTLFSKVFTHINFIRKALEN